jgi:hypothetical protein
MKLPWERTTWKATARHFKRWLLPFCDNSGRATFVASRRHVRARNKRISTEIVDKPVYRQRQREKAEREEMVLPKY